MNNCFFGVFLQKSKYPMSQNTLELEENRKKNFCIQKGEYRCISELLDSSFETHLL